MISKRFALVLTALLCLSLQAVGDPALPPVPQDALSPGLTPSYTAAIQHFRPDLDQHDAYTLATFIIESGHRNGHDTRLVLAILVEEGLLARVQLQGNLLRIGNESAAGAIDLLTLDLIERVERLQKDKKQVVPAVDRALAERATQALFRKDAKNPRALDYVPRVLKLYQQLCGTSATPGAQASCLHGSAHAGSAQRAPTALRGTPATPGAQASCLHGSAHAGSAQRAPTALRGTPANPAG